MTELPAGIVTFLATDVEGATRLTRLDAERAGEALARHSAILRETIDAFGGAIFSWSGDSFMAAFADASAALAAAVDAQTKQRREPFDETGPLKVRMALHTSHATPRAGQYYGPAVFETARLMAAANGSQILISEASRAAIGDRVPSATVLRDLGWLHLRDVPQPERAFEAISTDETLHVARERALLAFLFTDIVASTAVAVELGDQRWRALIDIHNRLVREILPRFRGREVRSTGDGVFAVFDAPSRAVEYARTLMDRLRPLGIEIRAGIHVGECEVVGEAFEGVAVHIAARVAALATGSEILVSSPVKDVVAGTAIAFDDHGSHVFKGLPGEWRLYSVAMR